MKRLAIVLLAQLALGAFGGEFVEAYLLIAEPGGELYSCAGHSALRLKCDTYNLDYCYSYESEMVSERVLTFLAGRLKMGMFALPTETYLSFYRNDGRGVKQYRLNLPEEAKKRLCKVMDDKVKEGVSLPYDFLERGCAQSDLQCLIEALKPFSIDFGHWPDHIAQKTRRELFSDGLDDFPWNRFFVYTLVGVEGDEMVSFVKRVVMPRDILLVLRQAKVEGKNIITDEGEVLVEAQPINGRTWFSPLVASGIILFLALLGWMKGVVGRFARGILYALYVSYAVFYTYMVFISSLPATSWHWLVVPFNILPIILWRWRRYWARPYAALLCLWELFMLLYPHQLTDTAYLVLVPAYIVLLARKC